MEIKYKGTIIEESLENLDILKDFNILSSKVSSDLEWHMHTVEVTEDQIQKLSWYIKPEKWYAHFWNSDDVIVVFRDKIFNLKHSDKSTWKEAVDYGKSVGIPEEQLDFIIN